MDAQITDHGTSVQQLHMNSFIQNNSMNLTTIKQLCHEQVKKLGFDYVSYFGYYPISEETHEISTFPKRWSQANSRLYNTASNPIALLSRNRTTAFLWHDNHIESVASNQHLADFLARAALYNVHNGVCFPIHGAGAEWGMLNIARNRNLHSVSLESIQILQLYALTVHEAVKRAYGSHVKKLAQQKSLSPRECECLNWIAAGKTAWETAKIIGITESTVSFHVRNTIVKLNANNRAQAVAVAMARSLINNPYEDQARQSSGKSSH